MYAIEQGNLNNHNLDRHIEGTELWSDISDIDRGGGRSIWSDMVRFSMDMPLMGRKAV